MSRASGLLLAPSCLSGMATVTGILGVERTKRGHRQNGEIDPCMVTGPAPSIRLGSRRRPFRSNWISFSVCFCRCHLVSEHAGALDGLLHQSRGLGLFDKLADAGEPRGLTNSAPPCREGWPRSGPPAPASRAAWGNMGGEKSTTSPRRIGPQEPHVTRAGRKARQHLRNSGMSDRHDLNPDA
jgi:hypothetical protein